MSDTTKDLHSVFFFFFFFELETASSGIIILFLYVADFSGFIAQLHRPRMI